MNKAILVGNLVRDPEVKYTQNGKAVASFSIAINEGYSDKQKTTYIPVVAWEKLGEICGNNLSKGRKVLVEGRIQVRNYEAKDGTKRYVTEVIAQNIEFMTPKGQNGSLAATGNNHGFGGEELPDEEIPF